MSTVVTGEAVALDLRLARIPSRLLAALVDGLAQLLVLMVLLLLAGGLSLQLDAAAATALGTLITVTAFGAYPVAFETLWSGRTPGKAAMGLRVVRDDGGPIGFRQALVRGLFALILEKPGVFFFLPALLSMLVSERSKRLGDLLAGTVVRQERVPTRTGPVAQMPPALAGWAATLDLSGLPDDLALSARQFLGRAADLTPAAREDLGGRLARAVAAAVHPPPPPRTPGWALLSAVLAERRRREELRLRPPAGPTPPGPPVGPPTGGRPAVDFSPRREYAPGNTANDPFAPPG